MSKSSQAFRTIREVSDWLEVKAHVLRFWESKFPQIKPVKRAGGRRYYRPADMELVGGIKVLLHEQGMTIRGVQSLIRDEGVAHVAALSPPIDILDFEEASADEIAAWDRELSADTEDVAQDGPQDTPPAPEPGATPQMPPQMQQPDLLSVMEAGASAPEPEEALAEPPSDLTYETEEDTDQTAGDEPAIDLAEGIGDEAEPAFELEPEPKPESEAASEPEQGPESETDSQPEPEPDSEPEEEFVAWNESGAELIKQAEAEGENVQADVPMPDPVARATDPDGEVPASQDAPFETVARTDEASDEGSAEDAQPAPAALALQPPAAGNTDPMILLVAEFADCTACIPEMDTESRAKLGPLLQRSAELAARMAAG